MVSHLSLYLLKNRDTEIGDTYMMGIRQLADLASLQRLYYLRKKNKSNRKADVLNLLIYQKPIFYKFSLFLRLLILLW